MESTSTEKLNMKDYYNNLKNYKNFLGRNLIQNWFSNVPGIPSKINQIINDKTYVKSKDTGEIKEFNFHLSRDQISDIIKLESPSLYDHISSIDENCKNASIGQVQKVTTSDSNEYAIKVQYPDIKKTISKQIGTLIKYSFVPPFLKFKFDTDSYKDYLKESLMSETNYLSEAKSQKYFFEYFKDTDDLIIPNVYEEYSTDSMLTQSWEYGDSIDKVSKSWDKTNRFKAAQTLTRAYLHMIFKCKKIQADLNFGNISFVEPISTENPKVILYDFGSVLNLDSQHVHMFWKMIDAYQSKSDISIFDYFLALGFDGEKLKYIADKLPAITRCILEPFLENRPCRVSQLTIGENINKILLSDKWWFRTAGPPWFFIFLKALGGLFNVLKTLDVNVNFFSLLRELDLRKDFEHKELDIPVDQHKFFNIDKQHSNSCAECLEINVKEGDVEKVNLTYPYYTIDFLEELVPEKYAKEITKRGIDLVKIKEQIQQSGYKRQLVINENFDHMTIKIRIA